MLGAVNLRLRRTADTLASVEAEAANGRPSELQNALFYELRAENTRAKDGQKLYPPTEPDPAQQAQQQKSNEYQRRARCTRRGGGPTRHQDQAKRRKNREDTEYINPSVKN
ncbi:hypothetical protein EYR40_001744 [Pleurotus pulmonarius]|nr:hypothetical protein EYR40_001744 [Pleurotus pulmonarius]